MNTINTRGTVLVIDDEPVSFYKLKSHLEDRYDLQHAASGIDGLFKARTLMPDLILLDIDPPDIDGHALCRMLKADPAVENIPVLFLTARDAPEEETRGLQAGAVDYIARPFNPAIVNARIATQMELKQRRDYANELVRLDGLTRITNRPGFDEVLTREWRRSLRAKLPLSLVMMDIDSFRRFNDQYGHLAGDECLQKVVSCLNTVVNRGGDTLARYGGEEFAAILFDTPFDVLAMITERFRAAVEAAGMPHADSRAADVVTISAGAATIIPKPEQNPESLVSAADQALYEVKQAGGNGIRVQQMDRPAATRPVLVKPVNPAASTRRTPAR